MTEIRCREISPAILSHNFSPAIYGQIIFVSQNLHSEFNREIVATDAPSPSEQK